jgi:hypothetical protein
MDAVGKIRIHSFKPVTAQFGENLWPLNAPFLLSNPMP